MKRIIAFLMFFLLVLIGMGKYIDQEAMFSYYYMKEFDTTVNIATRSDAGLKNIKKLEKLASQYDLQIIKEEAGPKKTQYGKQKIKLYLFLTDSIWFKKTFKNIEISKNENQENQFAKAEKISLLTTKEVEIVPLSDLDENQLNGDYYFKGSLEEIETFLKELNNSDLDIEGVIEFGDGIYSDLNFQQFILYIIFLFIIVISLLFSMVVYNGSLSKELAVAELFGYSKISFSFVKSFQLLIAPSLSSMFLTTVILFYLTKPDSILGFLFSVKNIIFIICGVSLLFIILEFLLIFYKNKKINTVLWLKGYKSEYNKSSNAIKIISITAVFYFVMVCSLGMRDYLTLKPYLKNWKKSENYLNIACTWPWTYVKEDEKFERIVLPNLNNLWDELDEEGAILFNAPNQILEGFEENDVMESLAFNGRYAFINSNYLNQERILDVNNNPIKDLSLEEGEWIVFVPEDIEITEFDNEKIQERQQWESSSQNKKESIQYINIKKGQTFFTFDSKKRLDEPNVENYILILVNGKDLDPSKAVKIPSLVNGEFHPHVSDNEKSLEKIHDIFEKTDTKPYILYTSRIYDEIFYKIEIYKIEIIIYFIGFILSLLICGVFINMDQESYFYHEGQRIDVSRLFGYSFYSIHKKKIFKNFTGYILTFICLTGLIFFTGYFENLGFYCPRDGWTGNKLLITLLISIIFSIILFTIEIRKIKKKDKNIAERLKQGS